MITRERVDANSFLWPDGTVPYAQFGPWPRPDCSGYVGGLCWAIPVPVSTVTLVTDGWMHEIAPTSAKLGDALGRCGPGTGGNEGHIQLFRGWSGAIGGALAIAEQAGGAPGPRHHTVKRPTSGYKFYRFKDIVDVLPPDQPREDDMSVKLINVTKGPMAGSVFKLYPTDLGMAYEPLSAELGPATQLWGTQIDVENPDIFGRPIAAIRAEWAAMGGTGGGGAVPFSISLSGSATPKL